MPDTGAPWNIPYVEAADLVSDWPADSLALANAIDAGLDAALLPGIGSNVVQKFKNDTFSTTSTAFTPVTDLEVDITPTTNTSKVLVIATLGVGHSNSNFLVAVNLRRGTTNLAQPSSGTSLSSLGANDVGTALASTSLVFLDSPNTASSVNYNITMRVTSGTGYLNRGGNDPEVTRVSTLTVIEVAP